MCYYSHISRNSVSFVWDIFVNVFKKKLIYQQIFFYIFFESGEEMHNKRSKLNITSAKFVVWFKIECGKKMR